MSTDFRSKAVIGVKLENLYTVQKERVQVTKFNPDTGVPFQQDVLKARYFWCGKEIEEEPDDMEDYVEQHSLQVHRSGYSNLAIVGYLLGEADAGDVVAIKGAEISKRWAEVKETLLKAGYKDNNVELHIIAYAG